MITISFNEDEWRHDIVTNSGKVIASVEDEDEAKKLKSFYEKQNDQLSENEDDSAFWSWRNHDELGGE